MSLAFGVSIPFVDLLGFTLEQFEGGESVLHFPLQADHFNSFGVAHGGAIMTLLDVGMATAARSLAPELGVITIEMKTSFLRPGVPGAAGHLEARSRVLHRTKSMVFTESSVFDGDGQLCAHGTGTFKYVPRQVSAAGGVKPPATD